jgi:NADH-quinone oxidoreductase subunit G
MPLVKVTIDNIEVEVEAGTTILNAARKIGGNVVPPTMCYYSKLEGSGGKCRSCLVKVAQGSAKDPRPVPKLVASCRTTVQDGMVVENTTSPEVMENRRAITEFLLLNHPLDCPVCDQAGECDLQNLSYEHGLADTQTIEDRRTFAPIDIGDKIKLHMNRCILCYRCVMVADQLTDKRVHGVLGRGDHCEISTYITKAVDNDFSGNMIDVCPVGALTDKTFRFKSRVWFTKPFDAHRECPKCSGEVVLWKKGDEILRVTGRKDKFGELEAFICNDCRFECKENTDWTIEGPRTIERHSVISQNHYQKLSKPEIQDGNEK